MNIRRATPRDVDALAPLLEAFNAAEGIAWRPAPMCDAFVALCLRPSLGFALISEGRDVHGYTIVTYNYDLEFAGRDAFVTELFVVPSARRRGVATRLLQSAEREGRAHDVRALHLLVHPENAAQGLYRAAGFAESARVLMTKALA